MLSNEVVRKEVTTSHIRSDGILEDFCDEEYFKEHQVFKVHPNALQFILYYDDIEVANPLGAKSGVHKIGELLHAVYVYITTMIIIFCTK